MKRRLVRMMMVVVLVCQVAPAIAGAPQAASTPAAEESAELARKLSNPISDLVSVPLQFNWEQEIGPYELSRFILNVQPVIPFELSDRWNLILRIITPFIGQPPLAADGASDFGIGDLTTSFFFSPRTSSGFTMGFGPAFVTPSTYDPLIGSGRWSAGPTAVALMQQGPWTYGVLWNQVWSFAGDLRREDVSQMFVQPFLAYQATRTVTLTAQSESTANWEVDTDRWTVPINLQVSKLSAFGNLPASYLLGYGYYAAHPDIGPTWRIRAAVVILLPRARK
jgi:hypothetical protein